MKTVYLIGFRGTGFRDSRYRVEPALIWAGHVAMAFEGAEDSIFGFHPTPEAVAAAGGDEAVITLLKAGQTLDGALQADLAIFVRAAELAEQEGRTTVWQAAIHLPDEEFERIRQQALWWYNEQTIFAYAFPLNELMPDRDNCATFPRRLGLPLLDPIGQIKDYVRVLEEQGEPWKRRG